MNKYYTHPRFRDIDFLVVDLVVGKKRTLVKGWWVSKCRRYLHGFERLLIPTTKWNEFFVV